MPIDEGEYNGFRLSSTQGKLTDNNVSFYRLHVVHSENAVFNVRSRMTEDYIDFKKESIDPFGILKEDALSEARRRIDNSDYENGKTYESTIRTNGKTPYREVADE